MQLDVVVNGPIRYWEDERKVGKIKFPININLVNSGGVPCAVSGLVEYMEHEDVGSSILLDCEDTKNWNKVEVVLDKENGISYFCSNLKTDSMLVDLWKGQSTTITCEVEMDVPPTGTAGFIQKNIKVALKYDYIIDRSTSVEVIGRQQNI